MQQINKTVLYVQSAHPSSREGTKQQNDFQPPLTCRVLLPMLFMIQVIVLCTTLANIRRYKFSTPLYKTGNSKAFSSFDQINKKVRYLVHILNVFPTFFCSLILFIGSQLLSRTILKQYPFLYYVYLNIYFVLLCDFLSIHCSICVYLS